jgi:hypothetical protein
MKKGFTFLLLLITLAGTFFPCCLGDKCNDEEITTSQKQNNKQEEGNCSPFFACASCTGFTIMTKPVQIVQPVTEIQVHPETFVVFNLTTYSSSFWQPPRSC